jgi:hypothetical protein
MKLYIFVAHYLLMCMKEYGCCPKFERGDHSTYTFTKKGVVYLVSGTDGQGDSYIPPNFVCKGYNDIPI